MSRARLRENSSTSTLPIFIGSWDGARKGRSSLPANYLANYWSQGPQKRPFTHIVTADMFTANMFTADMFTAVFKADMACASQPRKASLWAIRGGPVSGL